MVRPGPSSTPAYRMKIRRAAGTTAAPEVPTLVLKIGGRALEAPGAASELAADLRQLVTAGHRVVVIHGGGAEVTAWSRRLGIESRFHDGLRVSDPATLEVAVAVLAGLANKRLVAALRAAGLHAIGLAALDGGIALVVPHPEAASLGEVGAVRAIAPRLLDVLLERGALPVLASIGADGERLLNLNADDFAAALAPEIGAGTLVLLSDTPGLQLDGARVPALDLEGLDAALAHPDVQGGMAPKLRAARAAMVGGTSRVVIAAWAGAGTLMNLVTGDAAGTVCSLASAKETARG